MWIDRSYIVRRKTKKYLKAFPHYDPSQPMVLIIPDLSANTNTGKKTAMIGWLVKLFTGKPLAKRGITITNLQQYCAGNISQNKVKALRLPQKRKPQGLFKLSLLLISTSFGDLHQRMIPAKHCAAR